MLNPLKVRKILKKGVPATAVVQSMTAPPRGASKFNLGMTLHVYVEGRAPYEVQDQWLVSAKAPLGFGMRLPVKVDRTDPTEVAIDWDAHMVAQQEAAEQRRADLAARGPVDGPPPASTAVEVDGDPDLGARILEALGGAAASSPDDSDDTLARLERLAALRDAGALTDDEFDRLKGEILGG
ncbi:MAG: SHOCT domain-containing protein [Acidimicrobiia bacterium]|nr:SHOCT domain-containing protein [Acidimicrobiia bacterium]